MADLGLAFDDEDLVTNRRKQTSDKHLPYHVKLNTPRWFEQPCSEQDNTSQDPLNLKFCADYRYLQKDFKGAVEYCCHSLDILPESNVTVSQDLRETLSRSYTHLGEYEDALRIARDLVEEMSKEDEARQRQSLILLAFVCEKAGQRKECIDCLQKLCLLQPSYPQFWHKLGDALQHSSQLELRLDTQLQDDEAKINETHENVQEAVLCWTKEAEESTLLSIITCYVRAKLLFGSVLGNASGIVKERNNRLIKEILDKINRLPLPENLKQEALATIPKYLEVSKDDKEIKNDSPPCSDEKACMNTSNVSSVFYKRFCSWVPNKEIKD